MLEQKIEAWYNKIGKKIFVIGTVIVLVYIIIKFDIFRLMTPFIVAWLFASMLNPTVTWLNKKMQLPRGIGAILSMMTLLSGVLWLIAWLIRQLWYQMVAFSSTFPEYSEKFMQGFWLLEEKIGGFSDLDRLLEQILEGISTFLTSMIPDVYQAIIKVPNMMLFLIVMLIATFFMTKDYYDIKAFIKAQFSDTFVDRFVLMQRGTFGALGGYIRTQLILMIITFTLCLIGLLLFRIDYALLISIVIAVIDALPVFGSGAVLWPWAVYNVVIGNYTLAIGLFGIYGVIFVMRQIMEPKILSHQIGLYALVTVMSMYIGFKVMGVLGLILGPIIMVIIKTLQSIGALPKFKAVKGKEDEEDKKGKKGKEMKK